MTPSPTANQEKKEEEEVQKPEIFLQREIFSNLMSKGNSLKDIYDHLQKSSTCKAPTMRTLRTWRKKWENNRFTISDGRAGRVMCKSKIFNRTASMFKKSGIDSIRQFSKIYDIPISTVSRHLKLAGMHYCKSYEVTNVPTQDRKNKRGKTARKLKGELENSRSEECGNHTTLDETPLNFKNTRINVWKCVVDSYPRVEKASLMKKKMTLTIAMGGQGVVLVDRCKGEDCIILCKFCNTVLSSIQQWARKGIPTTGVSSDKQILKTIQFKQTRTSPYASGLAPYDFHLFGWMKFYFANTNFKSIEDAEEQISHWVDSIPNET